MARTTNKHERLTAAANSLFLQKGFNMTTLADIANDANVPLGNVYYYFKTKSHIAIAVIELQHKNIRQNLESLSEEIEPAARLNKLVQHCLSNDVDDNEKLGVLMVGLWNDLSVESGEVFVKFQEATQSIITWCASQFEKIGKGAESQHYAQHLFAYLQGLLLYRKPNPISSHELQAESLMIAKSLGFAQV